MQATESLDIGIDMRQFHAAFFEEAAENGQAMEQMLLALDPDAADDETLNAVFRCAHSIKGGAATFGFADVATLTHEMESLLDRLRRHEIPLRAAMVDHLLQASDALKDLLAVHQGTAADAPDTTPLVEALRPLAADTPPAPAAAAPAAQPAQAPAGREVAVTIGPVDQPGLADDLATLFRDIPGLGTLEPVASDTPLVHRFVARTTASDEELLEHFSFHVTRDLVALAPKAEEAAAPAAAEGHGGDGGYDSGGPFQGAPGVPAPGATSTTAAAATPAPAAERARPAAASAGDASTLRVSVGKIDQLINLVGELVITQSMLALRGQGLDPVAHEPLLGDLNALARNTRDLQEAVMSIRMIPVSVVFSRYPRMVRDLATRLGKRVELVTVGDATELDKGLIEKIIDPLTHLVRNCTDHGIETPEQRLAAGKPAHGTITLSAFQQGGSIVIEVTDDGRGLSRDVILAKALERGLPCAPDMSDAQVWGLIFEPGFSTAQAVTDVSGRGVGMDVVKRNIAALGGSIDIESTEGRGMRVSVRVPLTLAIMDGMSVRVGPETYILPLTSVIESFVADHCRQGTLAQGAAVVQVRDEILPVVSLRQLFDVPAGGAEGHGVMIVVEAEGLRAAVQVDELLGQHQVVVKNLEANYRKVDALAGATILGDGRVALIIEPRALTRRAKP